MVNLEGFEERLKKIENKYKQIDRLDREVYVLNQKLEKATDLLVEIVENSADISKYDLKYVLLKLNIDALKYHELPMLVSRTERHYRNTGKYPDLLTFHKDITRTLSLSKDDLNVFSIEVTINFLENFLKDDANLFGVCRKILATRQ